MDTQGRDARQRLLRRYAGNPVLTAGDWPYFVNTVFNAGATRLPSGETLLLCRVEDCSGRSHFCVARSADGVSSWQIDPEPTLEPEDQQRTEERWGIEDPRLVWVPELQRYAITYTSYSHGGPGVSLALTEDFKTFERIGSVMAPEDKDAALLPERVNGRWAMIHRPVSPMVGAHIWISFSPDLKHWGDHTLVLPARRGPWWDANRIGLSPPLIPSDEGWLMMYHGVRHTPAGCLYRIGLALLDRENPAHCLLRSNRWMFGPEAEYERTGDVGDVVFPCGYTLEDDGDTLHLYYGAADTCIALATGSVRKMISWLKKVGIPAHETGD
ncbi:MAG: glycosidase [Phycisphaerae bacterium]